ncbi:MAG: SspB family protein [Pseudomonadota bacterium]
MSKDILDYQALVQEALRGVVRAVLLRVEKDGRLPGAHHFYITFDTMHPGVKVSDAIRQRYPQEMTIVLQHQFWDLHTGQEDFQVTLSFNNVAEKLSVPFVAVKNFFDPSTRFGLQFTLPGAQTPPAGTGRVLEPPAKDGQEAPAAETRSEPAPRPAGEVISLDTFRKK